MNGVPRVNVEGGLVDGEGGVEVPVHRHLDPASGEQRTPAWER